MSLFDLPLSSKVDRVIPKNSFDDYASNKVKKLFTNQIQKILWKNKLSVETINLRGKEIDEIQIFEIELKEKVYIPDILNSIDKSIPYHIVFIIKFSDDVYVSVSPKHLNPINANSAVIDHTFKTEWFSSQEFNFKIDLKNSIDDIFYSFCCQFSPTIKTNKNLQDFISANKELDRLNRDIQKINQQISQTKQYNKKVELNQKLLFLENNIELFIKKLL
jgi:hypothetical protein